MSRQQFCNQRKHFSHNVEMNIKGILFIYLFEPAQQKVCLVRKHTLDKHAGKFAFFPSIL